VNEFSLYTAGILAFFLILTALLINRYFSRLEPGDEETLINVLMEKKAMKRDELKKITGFSDEELDRMIESIEEIIEEGDEIRYAGSWREKRSS